MQVIFSKNENLPILSAVIHILDSNSQHDVTPSAASALFNSSPMPLSSDEQSQIVQRIGLNYSTSVQLIVTIQLLYAKILLTDEKSLKARAVAKDLLENLIHYRNSLKTYWYRYSRLSQCIRKSVDRELIKSLQKLRWLIPADIHERGLSLDVLRKLAVDQGREFELKCLVPAIHRLFNRPVIDKKLTRLYKQYGLTWQNLSDAVFDTTKAPEKVLYREWNNYLEQKLLLINKIVQQDRIVEEQLIDGWTDSVFEKFADLLETVDCSKRKRVRVNDFSTKIFNSTGSCPHFSALSYQEIGPLFYSLLEPQSKGNDLVLTLNSNLMLEREFNRFSSSTVGFTESLKWFLLRTLVSINEIAFNRRSHCRLGMISIFPQKETEKMIAVAFTMGSQRLFHSRDGSVSEISPKGITPFESTLGESIKKDLVESGFHLELIELEKGDILFLGTSGFCQSIDPVYLETPFPGSFDPEVEQFESTYGWCMEPKEHQKALESAVQGIIKEGVGSKHKAQSTAYIANKNYLQAMDWSEKKDEVPNINVTQKPSASVMIIEV